MPFLAEGLKSHNITGKFAVVQGNGDIKMGLPLQSVMESDLEMYHQPLLSVAIQAPVSKGERYLIKERTS
jgi:uncharacterized protein YbcC (UPF0753/DUF2309 family)